MSLSEHTTRAKGECQLSRNSLGLQRLNVAMWSTLFALTFLITVALSLAAIRLNF